MFYCCWSICCSALAKSVPHLRARYLIRCAGFRPMREYPPWGSAPGSESVSEAPERIHPADMCVSGGVLHVSQAVGGPTRRRPVLPVPAPPRRPAVLSPVPKCPWYVRVLDSTNLFMQNKFKYCKLGRLDLDLRDDRPNCRRQLSWTTLRKHRAHKF